MKWSSIWWTVALVTCLAVGFVNRWQAGVGLGIMALACFARSLMWFQKEN